MDDILVYEPSVRKDFHYYLKNQDEYVKKYNRKYIVIKIVNFLVHMIHVTKQWKTLLSL